MAVTLNESGSESAVFSQEEDNARREQYLERRNLILQFLQSNLSFQHLQHHYTKVELMKKCTFYLEAEPRHCNVRNHNNEMHCVDIWQFIDLSRFRKMKKVAKEQIEIQLTLLTELLEELQRGRLELRRYTDTWDMATFLSRWDFIKQRVAKLSEFMEQLVSLEAPGGLHTKHRLVSHADLGGMRVPEIKLSISMKVPLIFDRRQSFADCYCARLVWFTEDQESPDPCELLLLIQTNTLREDKCSKFRVVNSNTCLVLDLQPGRSYRFKIRRAQGETFVCSKWQDSITLTTRPNAIESVPKNTCAPGYGQM